MNPSQADYEPCLAYGVSSEDGVVAGTPAGSSSVGAMLMAQGELSLAGSIQLCSPKTALAAEHSVMSAGEVSQLQAVRSGEGPAGVQGLQDSRSGNPKSQGCKQWKSRLAGDRSREPLEGASARAPFPS